MRAAADLFTQSAHARVLVRRRHAHEAVDDDIRLLPTRHHACIDSHCKNKHVITTDPTLRHIHHHVSTAAVLTRLCFCADITEVLLVHHNHECPVQVVAYSMYRVFRELDASGMDRACLSAIRLGIPLGGVDATLIICGSDVSSCHFADTHGHSDGQAALPSWTRPCQAN